ncbi:MAG: ABC transporter ATP-binding protein, partial [Halobacteriaceae archaeon]
KIRREEYADLSEEVWDSIERFREVVRERSRVDLRIRDRVYRNIGRFSRFDDIDEAVNDLFGDLDVPDGVYSDIQTATTYVKEGRAQEAREYLNEQFDGPCDTTRPELYDVGDTDRQSYCLRHTSEYDIVEETLERRLDSE